MSKQVLDYVRGLFLAAFPLANVFHGDCKTNLDLRDVIASVFTVRLS